MKVEFHPSQYPGAARERLIARLRAGELPARFLYDSPAQAARWLAYHAAWSPSRTDRALLDLYHRQLGAALARMHERLGYVGVGCGGGTKDALFLRQAGGRVASATVADTSPSLVLEALAQSPGARGLVVDLEAQPERAAFTGGLPTVWTAFGMVPNLDAPAFLRWLARVMGPDDLALVSANLHPESYPTAAKAILPQYDNPPARSWYRGALAELGLAAIDPEVRAEPLTPGGEAWRVVVEAAIDRPAVVPAFDVEIPLEAGTRLRVFFSNRFTPTAFESGLAEAGLLPLERALFEGAQEGIWTVRRA